MHVPGGDLALQLLESGELDVIMSSQPLKGMGVHNETLTDISLATLIWKQERLTKRRFPMALYLKRPHVIIRMPDRQGSIVDQTLASLGLQRPIGAVVQNFMAMPMVAARTGYICNVPSRMATMFAELFDLSVHEPPIDFAATPLCMSWHKRFEGGSGARVAVAAGPQYGAVTKGGRSSIFRAHRGGERAPTALRLRIGRDRVVHAFAHAMAAPLALDCIRARLPHVPGRALPAERRGCIDISRGEQRAAANLGDFAQAPQMHLPTLRRAVHAAHVLRGAQCVVPGVAA